jgi:hypothetical protein
LLTRIRMLAAIACLPWTASKQEVARDAGR